LIYKGILANIRYAETLGEKGFAAKLGEAQNPAKSGTKNLKSSNPKGSLLRAGGRGVWGEFRPPYKSVRQAQDRFWAKSVRIFSNAHRHPSLLRSFGWHSHRKFFLKMFSYYFYDKDTTKD